MKAANQAVSMRDIVKRVGTHTLGHCFATHPLMTG